MSFIKYTTPEAKEKIKNAAVTFKAAAKKNSFFPKINGRKIKKFLTQCFGLKEKNKYFIIDYYYSIRLA
jgi:hypothetical protein